MDWGFIVFVGTILFFAALHQWPPDGRRWEREDVKAPVAPPVAPPVAQADETRSLLDRDAA